MGCPLQLVSAETVGKACRVLQDQCRGSIYALDGRVYPKQFATKNLLSPDYRLQPQGDDLLLLIELP